MTESAKKYAIIEFDIDSCRLGYFDDKKDILFNSDIYWFPARADMTDEQYEEYVFTLKDLIQHYEFVLVCTAMKQRNWNLKSDFLIPSLFQLTSIDFC